MGSCAGNDADWVLFHMSIVQCNAASVAEKQGDMDAAISWIEEGLMVQQSVLRDDHRVVTTVSRTLSRLDGIEEDFEMLKAPRYHHKAHIEIECGPTHFSRSPDVHAMDITHHQTDPESLNLF